MTIALDTVLQGARCRLIFSSLPTKTIRVPRLPCGAELLPSLAGPSLYRCKGLFLPRGRTYHLLMFNFIKVAIKVAIGLFLWPSGSL